MSGNGDEDGDSRASLVAINAACKRKLVHWVNSLPLASCLLVEELAELRHGDVLWAIIAWLETGDSSAGIDEDVGDQRTLVARVVQYAAQRCCARDSDVMYVVHGAQCVTRVLEGDAEAIAAVLLVLKRLAEDVHKKKRSQEKSVNELLRREMNWEIARHTTTARREGTSQRTPQRIHYHHENLNEASASTTTRRRQSGSHVILPMKAAKNYVESPTQPERREKNWDQRNVPRSPLSAVLHQSKPTQHTGIGALDNRVFEWLQYLGVKIPVASKSIDRKQRATSIRSLLKDGVVLCVLAAAIVRRRGSVSIRHKLHTVRSSPGTVYERGVLFPQAAALEPRTQAEKRQNLTTAWKLLDECKMLDLSASAMIRDADTLVQILHAEREDEDTDSRNGQAVRSLLANVMDQFGRVAYRDPVTTTKADVTSSADAMKSTCKRPYITAEQIAAVKKWMKASGVDPNAVSSGILEDSLRNGVALCQLIRQAYGSHHAKLEFKNPPKTLVEVRENIRKTTTILKRDSKLPLVYLTSQAVEGIIMGDKQYIHGILWYFMQFRKDEEAQTHQQRSQQTVDGPRFPPPPPPPHPLPVLPLPQEETAVTPPIPCEEPRLRQLRPAPRQASAFELDILASELVEEEASEPISPLVWASGRGLRWHDVEMHEDVVPFAILREDPPPEASWDADIVPQKRPRPHVPRDLLPDLLQASEITAQTSARTLNTCVQDPEDQHIVEVTAVAEDTENLPACTQVRRKERPPTPTFTTSQVDQVIVWLKNLGINLRHPSDLENSNAKLSEFQSGVLLCTIVEKLEHMRCMEGVCRQENPAKAQALHNIDKALVVLQSKKAIPLHVIRNKWKLYAGDRTAILDLLIRTKKAYGTQPTRKPKSDQIC